MPKLIVLRGLPASFKSSWAIKQLNSRGTDKVARLNLDLMREQLHASIFSKDNERWCNYFQTFIATTFLNEGLDIIIDNTNLNPSVIEHWKKVAEDYDAEFEIKEFNTPVQECIERDSRRDKPVGEKVIKQMAQKWLKPEEDESKTNPNWKGWDMSLPLACIFDLDGTLALMGSRNP